MAVIHLVQADCGAHDGTVGRNCRQRLKVQIGVEIFIGAALVAHIELTAVVLLTRIFLRYEVRNNIVIYIAGCNNQGRVNGNGKGPSLLMDPCRICGDSQQVTICHFCKIIPHVIGHLAIGIDHVRRRNLINCFSVGIVQQDGTVFLRSGCQIRQRESEAVCITGLKLVNDDALLDIETNGIILEIHAGENIRIKNRRAELRQLHLLRNLTRVCIIQTERHDLTARIDDLGLRLLEQPGRGDSRRFCGELRILRLRSFLCGRCGWLQRRCWSSFFCGDLRGLHRSGWFCLLRQGILSRRCGCSRFLSLFFRQARSPGFRLCPFVSRSFRRRSGFLNFCARVRCCFFTGKRCL